MMIFRSLILYNFTLLSLFSRSSLVIGNWQLVTCLLLGSLGIIVRLRYIGPGFSLWIYILEYIGRLRKFPLSLSYP
jgi:hypothetical protein